MEVVRKEVEVVGLIDECRLDRLVVCKYNSSDSVPNFSVGFNFGVSSDEEIVGKEESVFFSRKQFEDFGCVLRRIWQDKEGHAVIGGLTVDYLHRLLGDSGVVNHVLRFAWSSGSGLDGDHDAIVASDSGLYYAVQDLLYG